MATAPEGIEEIQTQRRLPTYPSTASLCNRCWLPPFCAEADGNDLLLLRAHRQRPLPLVQHDAQVVPACPLGGPDTISRFTRGEREVRDLQHRRAGVFGDHRFVPLSQECHLASCLSQIGFLRWILCRNALRGTGARANNSFGYVGIAYGVSAKLLRARNI